MLRASAPALLCAVLLIGCSVAPSPSGPVASPSIGQSAETSLTPNATVSSTASLPPLPPSASLPVRRSAQEIGELVAIAPGADGSVFVSIPGSEGAVVARLDHGGLPRPGWPVLVPASPCGLLLPVNDGSVRLVCRQAGDRFVERPSQAFAFDGDGRPREGWPVGLSPGCCRAGRVIGDDLTLFTQRQERDSFASVTIVARDGAIRRGAEVRESPGCNGWGVGLDAVAYGAGCDNMGRAIALDLDGLRGGWPVSFDGIASAPAFAAGGRIVVVVGPFARDSSRILVLEATGNAVSAASANLPISTVRSPELGDVDCAPVFPEAPIVGQDGTIFVFSNMDTPVLALDPSLAIRPGWPFEPSTGLQRRIYVDPGHDGITCSSLATPAAVPNSTLYLPLAARDATVGGSIVAVGPDGRVVTGWPVELQRPGSEFWSVVVGSDGTVYALAIEPEAGDTFSASILAFAPDSTVVYATTIVEP